VFCTHAASSAQHADDAGELARANNRYVEAMQNISAPELIKGFAETAPMEVQQAVRSTVVSLLGNLPPHLYDLNVMSTGQNVASLMYSMQMTGYMFVASLPCCVCVLRARSRRSPLLPRSTLALAAVRTYITPRVSSAPCMPGSATPSIAAACLRPSRLQAPLQS
jgi:hypothetical protein